MTEKRRGSPRYKRSGKKYNLQLTEDDHAVFRHCYRHRVIDNQCLYSLFPTRSINSFSKRLRTLWDAGYLDRLGNRTEQHTPGSEPLIVALGRKGARALITQMEIERTDLDPSRLTNLNRRIKPISIRHELEITRFMVHLDIAARAEDGFCLRYADEFIDQKEVAKRTRGPKNTLSAAVRWKNHDITQGTQPDRIFCLRKGDVENYFMLEIDLGTETIWPSEKAQRSEHFWRKSSLLKKYLIYVSALEQRAHERQFGLPLFRVLTVTTTPQRAEQMRVKAVERGALKIMKKIRPGFFWFTDFRTLAKANYNPLTVSYVTGNGKHQKLLKS